MEGVSRFGNEGLKQLWKEINLFLSAKKASILNAKATLEVFKVCRSVKRGSGI